MKNSLPNQAQSLEMPNVHSSIAIPMVRDQENLDSQITQKTDCQDDKNEKNNNDDIKFLKAFYTVIKCFIPSFISLYIEFGVYFSNVLFSGFIGDASFISG